MITSVKNEKIKSIINLNKKASHRREESLFVTEGYRIFKEIPVKLLKEVYVSESFSKSHEMKDVLGALDKAKELGVEVFFETVSDDVLKKASDTVTPQGVIAIVRMRANLKVSDYDFVGNKNILVLDRVRDPGNMGTIIRTAEGAGVDLILMHKECVDIYSPKVTRSTMGSLFRVNICISDDLPKDINFMRSKGIKTYAAHLNGAYYDENEAFSESSAIMIGNEANGLSDEVSKCADKLIKIPMCGKLESLNAAVAAGVLMYEANKVKRKMGKSL